MAGPSWAWPTATFLSEGLSSDGPNQREMTGVYRLSYGRRNDAGGDGCDRGTRV
jgi:hypothetical protein